ncbi:MAG: lysophospholipid acyltransferase family protein [Verrucomicrobiales bacterium]|nr:lysophospholipid acyltransferase family protein [Verrucomicrobiales bacterium]
MPEKPKTSEPPLTFKAKAIGFGASLILRSVCATTKFELRDHAGIVDNPPSQQLIWCFWHNRIFAMPPAYRRYLKSRSGAVLTSPSNDGAMIATTLKCFGVDAVRGSSSRGGIKALLSLKKWIANGFDVAITPDGPRGPRYILAPGLIMLAQKTGAAILPIRIDYSDFWRLRSWDQFQIPKPFSKITVTFEPLQFIDPELDEAGFEEARLRVQNVMNPNGETD